ncbi:MAG: hypothetical protein K2H70_06280, partial [Bacteroidales bacterium]|nr:hypothetical protein [Bacteroidales bacterium]
MKGIKSLRIFGLGCGLMLWAVAVPAVAATVQATALPDRVAQVASPDAAAARTVRVSKLSAETRAFLAQWQSLSDGRGAKTCLEKETLAHLQEQYGLRSVPSAADAAASADADAATQWMLPVWLTFQSEAVAEEMLQAAEALGFTVQTRLKTICTGMIPVDRIEALAQLEGIRQIQCSQRAELRLDRLRRATKTDSVQDFGALDGPQVPSFRGEGVVVGVVDVGMEYVHPNFYDPDDTSHLRIQRVW